MRLKLGMRVDSGLNDLLFPIFERLCRSDYDLRMRLGGGGEASALQLKENIERHPFVVKAL